MEKEFGLFRHQLRLFSVEAGNRKFPILVIGSHQPIVESSLDDINPITNHQVKLQTTA